ncbi:AB hydrolase-1 domain-containing protein [[Candida] zeylanoides]
MKPPTQRNASDWDDSDEVADYAGVPKAAGEPPVAAPPSPHTKRRLSRPDVHSIVGGTSLEDAFRSSLVLDGAGPRPPASRAASGATDSPPESSRTGSTSTTSSATTTVSAAADAAEIHPSADELSTEKTHPAAAPRLATPPRDAHDDVSTKATQKVFSFSLPFGGLSNLRSNLYRQLRDLDLHIPRIGSPFREDEPVFSDDVDTRDDAHVAEQIRLRLERQQSLNTIQEAALFRKFKGTDDARVRAVKQSITSSVSGIVHPTRKKSPHEEIFSELSGNVVILGGYRGSILRSAKTGKRVWIPYKAGLNLRKVNLLLGPTLEDELRAHEIIYADGMLKSVGPMDICKKLIKRLDANPRINIKDFGYDWRLSGEVMSAQLEEFLSKMYTSTGKPIIVIAHSMGGMVAHAVMQRRPEMFRSLVYVGCPSECLNILGPIRFGDSVILSDKILTPEANFMMRSGFNFLPLSGRVFVNRRTKEFYDLDYFNPDTWVEYNLSPLVAKRRKLQEASDDASAASSSTVVDSKTSASASASASASPVPATASTASTVAATPLAPVPQRARSESSFASIADNISTLGSRIRSCTPSIVRKRTHRTGSPLRGHTPPQPLDRAVSPERALELEDEEYTTSFAQAYRYLSESLARAKAFVLGLNYNPALEEVYPPLVVVYGNQVPSVRGSYVDSIDDIKRGNYYHFYYGHGDGVIHQRWLMPQMKGFDFFDPESGHGQIVGKFASACGHVNLMTDLDAMARALHAVVEAEAIWPQRKVAARRRLA